MCFGNSAQTGSTNTTSTTSTPKWLQQPAKDNLSFATDLQSAGFTPYSGNQVTDFSGQQNASFGLGSDIAGGISPYVGEAGSLIDSYANAGPQHVSPQTIADPSMISAGTVTPDTIASKMSPYMNEYVQRALIPQLQQQDLQFANQNKAVDSSATMAGAFGDTGWGQLRGTTTQAQDAARAGLIGNAYNTAFNTAIGAGAQDVSNAVNAGTTNVGNKLTADTRNVGNTMSTNTQNVANDFTGQVTNANLGETALGRQLTGANAINSTGTGATNLINTLGGQQTAQTQAQLNALYNQWQLGQQYPFQTTQLINSTLAAAKGAAPTTTTTAGTTAAPDNSGYGMIGTLAPAALSFLADGGRAPAGKPVVVGERGPEMLVPNANSVVIPAEVLAAAREKRDAKQAAPLQFGIAA